MRILLTEEQYELITEKIVLNHIGLNKYAELVAEAYENAIISDPKATKNYDALNQSNHVLWKRLLSRIQVKFVSEFKNNEGKIINIDGEQYEVSFALQPYNTAEQMSKSVKETGVLLISIDYSIHPYFSLEDNIIFRTVHDYIVHILGDKAFGLKGEIQSYNLHAKLVPELAKPAIFTEIVGQACYTIVNNKFPMQKMVILKGFDYDNIGQVEGWLIKDKQLQKISK